MTRAEFRELDRGNRLDRAWRGTVCSYSWYSRKKGLVTFVVKGTCPCCMVDDTPYTYRHWYAIWRAHNPEVRVKDVARFTGYALPLP